MEEESSSIVFVKEDKRSSKGPLVFGVSGKTRWCLNSFVVWPSVWSENGKLGWERNYKERNRMIEVFSVKKGYREFIERISNINYLPYEVNSAEVNDEYINIDDKHLPVGRISVLVVADNCDNDVTHLGLTINTNADLTILDVDMAYDKIIKGDNLENYYYGIMKKQIFMVIILTIVI